VGLFRQWHPLIWWVISGISFRPAKSFRLIY
jgi:hypothetical protein